MSDKADLDASALFKVPSMIAVVTGGGTGLGLMIAKALALNGAHKVYILGRRLAKLQEAAKASPHENILPLQCDVTSKDELAAAAVHIQREDGYINLIAVNSGTGGPSMAGVPDKPSVGQFKDFCWQWDPQEFNNTFAVNNTAAFFTSIAFLELLDAGNKRGNVPGVSSQVIITASIAAYLRRVFSGFAYVMSKAAAASLAKSLSTMLAPYGIRCNAFAPGLFPSEMTEGSSMISRVAHNQDGVVDRSSIPEGRPGIEDDMVGTTLYLASRAGAYCNGNILVNDGGRVSIMPSSY